MHWTLADLLADLVANAVDASATVIQARFCEGDDGTTIAVRDNGSGMPEEVAARAADPFVTAAGKHPGRLVGLGLAFLRQTAEATDGSWWLESAPERGTDVGVQIPAGAVDAPPPGDLVETFVQILTMHADGQVVIERTTPSGSYTLDRRALAEALEEEPGDMNRVGTMSLLRDFVAQQEEAVWER